MGKTQKQTPFYIRTRGGDTFFVDTLEEALEQFASDDGYRLTLEADGKTVVIRRYQEKPRQSSGTGTVYWADVTVQNPITPSHQRRSKHDHL